jgi:hypothetical protein
MCNCQSTDGDLWKQAIFISKVRAQWLTQQLPVTDGQVTTERNVASWTMIMTVWWFCPTDSKMKLLTQQIPFTITCSHF